MPPLDCAPAAGPVREPLRAAVVVSLIGGVLGFQPDAPCSALARTINLLELYAVTNLCFESNVAVLGPARRADASARAKLTVTMNKLPAMTGNFAGLTPAQSLPAETAALECGAYR